MNATQINGVCRPRKAAPMASRQRSRPATRCSSSPAAASTTRRARRGASRTRRGVWRRARQAASAGRDQQHVRRRGQGLHGWALCGPLARRPATSRGRGRAGGPDMRRRPLRLRSRSGLGFGLGQDRPTAESPHRRRRGRAQVHQQQHACLQHPGNEPRHDGRPRPAAAETVRQRDGRGGAGGPAFPCEK